MGKNYTENMNTVFGLNNVKRCFAAALLSVAVFPVIFVLSFVAPEGMASYMIPGAFFSVGSAAFAYLLHQVAKHKMRQYYSVVTWTYLAAFHLFFGYMARSGVWFYYATVVLMSYLMLLSVNRFIIMTLAELILYLSLTVRSGVAEIPLSQLITLAGIHLFAFVLSRDLYNTKKNYLLGEKKLRKEMKESEHDPMTGLLNRRGLERRVDEVWQTSICRKETVAAFVIDIDLFKSYNDRFGHLEGDTCIQRVARSISESVRGYGMAARIGGEEFLVFVRGRNVQEISDLAEQVRKDVMDLQISRGNGSVITVSVGMDVRYASGELSLQGLYGRADRALYQAKQDGRNCVRSVQTLREYRSRIG